MLITPKQGGRVPPRLNLIPAGTAVNGHTEQVGSEQEQWRQRRREAAEEQAARHHRRQAAESARAQVLVDRFVAAATEQGLRTTPLRARAYSGRATYRTGLTGWYLKRNGSLGVGTDGSFYVLSAPSSLRSRLQGVTISPGDPPLVVGVGGRDGESMPLQQLLDLRLAAGDDWPAPD
jgi:hypothetical protein